MAGCQTALSHYLNGTNVVLPSGSTGIHSRVKFIKYSRYQPPSHTSNLHILNHGHISQDQWVNHYPHPEPELFGVYCHIEAWKNSSHLANDIFKYIFLKKCYYFGSNFIRFVLHSWIMISQHWLRLSLGTEQVTSHYLNPHWPCSLSHIWIARGPFYRHGVTLMWIRNHMCR